jgi:putative ABC transport system ATP-binding protein
MNYKLDIVDKIVLDQHMVELLSEQLVVLEKVTKVYRVGEIETWALRGVDLVVERGEYIAVMGPSGSGKTTLLNIIGLLDKPTSGRVLVAGRDASRLSSRELAHLRNRVIGFVFQAFNLIPRYTVLENIELPLIVRGIPRRERIKLVHRALEMVGGDPSWLYKKPNQLSGGQQQRVAIARAIVGDPEIILADEPTGNLDRASSKIVVETFSRLNAGGQTIIVVTHDPEVANCTNKIYILRDGVIAEAREPDRNKCILYTVK